MARKVQPPITGCPWCGASGTTAWGTCLACGRYYLAQGWVRTPRGRPHFLWFMGGVGVIAILWALFLPDPVMMVFKRPTTALGIQVSADQWAMWGKEVQQRRYVAEVPRQVAGHLLWSVDLGTPTRSVPVIVDNVIYVGGHFQLMALDAHSGQRLWEIPTTGPVHTSPAVAGDLLYIGLQDWRVLALDRHTGTTRWEFRMHNPVAGSAAVAQGIVYIGSMDGFLYALDAATGKRLWSFKTYEQPLSPPALDAGTLFVGSMEGTLYTLHARTGQLLFRFRAPERVQETPVVANGLVYFPSGGQIFALDAAARHFPGQYHLHLAWTHFWFWGLPVPRPPAQSGGKWRFSPKQLPRGIISAPAVAPEAFYVGDVKGYLYARRALEGTELWQFQAGSAIMASPLILGPRVYFGADDGYLYALDRAQGELLWKLALGEPIHTAPVFASQRLYLRTTDGRLHAIE